MMHKNAWLRVIDEALVTSGLDFANSNDSYEEAKQKLNDLILWNISVAVDPVLAEQLSEEEILEAISPFYSTRLSAIMGMEVGLPEFREIEKAVLRKLFNTFSKKKFGA